MYLLKRTQWKCADDTNRANDSHFNQKQSQVVAVDWNSRHTEHRMGTLLHVAVKNAIFFFCIRLSCFRRFFFYHTISFRRCRSFQSATFARIFFSCSNHEYTEYMQQLIRKFIIYSRLFCCFSLHWQLDVTTDDCFARLRHQSNSIGKLCHTWLMMSFYSQNCFTLFSIPALLIHWFSASCLARYPHLLPFFVYWFPFSMTLHMQNGFLLMLLLWFWASFALVCMRYACRLIHALYLRKITFASAFLTAWSVLKIIIVLASIRRLNYVNNTTHAITTSKRKKKKRKKNRTKCKIRLKISSAIERVINWIWICCQNN